MEDIAARWVALDVLDDRQVIGPIDIEGDEGVDARIGGEAATQLGPGDRYRDRVGIEAVDDGGDLAFATEATGRAGAFRASGLGAQ